MNLINIEVRAAVRTYVFCLSGHNRYVNKVLQIFSRKYYYCYNKNRNVYRKEIAKGSIFCMFYCQEYVAGNLAESHALRVRVQETAACYRVIFYESGI